MPKSLKSLVYLKDFNNQSAIKVTSSASTSSTEVESTLSKFADCLTQDFAMMKNSLQQMNSTLEHRDRNLGHYLDEVNDDGNNSLQGPDNEFEDSFDSRFAKISGTNDEEEDVSPAINSYLGDLVNKILRK